MPEQYNEPSLTSIGRKSEQVENELVHRHQQLNMKMKDVLEEEARLLGVGADGPLDIDQLEMIHRRQDDILREQRDIEQRLGKEAKAQ